MKYISTFDDKDNIHKIDYSDISTYIKEEINLGNTKPYNIDHRLYKSGDYICSSFKIDKRDVIVSSIIINDADTICVNGGRHYNTLGDYISQFSIKTDIYLYIGFGEYLDGVYNDDKKYENVEIDTNYLVPVVGTEYNESQKTFKQISDTFVNNPDIKSLVIK